MRRAEDSAAAVRTKAPRSFKTRLSDAALLVPSHDRDATGSGGSTGQAVTIAFVAALGFGVATFLGWAFSGSPLTGLVAGLVLEPLVTLAAWLGGSAAAWLVGARLAPPDARGRRFWPVARALAFAQTPNLVGALVILPPPFRGGVWLMARLWMLASSSATIREALGLSGGRLLVTLFASAAVYTALLMGIFWVLSSIGVGSVASVHGIGGL